MNRFRLRLCVPLAVFAGLLATRAPAADGARRTVAETLPPDVPLVVTIPSLQAFKKRLAAGPLGRLMALPQIAGHIPRARKVLLKALATDIDTRQILEMSGLKLETIWETVIGEVTFALMGFDGLDKTPNFVVAVQGDPKSPAAAAVADHFADAMQKRLQQKATREKAMHAGVAFHVIKPVQSPFEACFAAHEGTFILTTRRVSMERVLEGLTGGDVSTLGATPWYARMKERAGGRTPDLFARASMPDLPGLALLNSQIRDANLKLFLTALKIANLEGASYAVSLNKADVRETLTVHIQQSPLLAASEQPIFLPLDANALDVLPRGTLAFVATNLSLRGLLAYADRIGKMIPLRPVQIREALKGQAQNVGVDLEDVFGALDGRAALTVSLPTRRGMPVTLVPDVLLTLGTADEAAADRVIAGLRKALNMWWGHLKIHDLAVGGHRGFAFTNPRRPREPLAPALGRVGKRVYVSPLFESVKRQMAGGGGGRRLADDPEFQALRQDAPENAMLIAYADTSALLTFLANTLPFLARVDQRDLPFDPVALPDGSVFTKHLSGTMLTVSRPADGVVTASRSPTGILPSVALTALAATYLDQAHRMLRIERSQRQIADALKTLHKALQAYNTKNNGPPAKLSDLYPDFVPDISTFTYNRYGVNRNIAYGRPGQKNLARRYIDSLTTFLYLQREFGKPGRPLLSLLPYRFPDYRAPFPVINGNGEQLQMSRTDLVKALRQAGYDSRGKQPRHVPIPRPTQRPAKQTPPKPKPNPRFEDEF